MPARRGDPERLVGLASGGDWRGGASLRARVGGWLNGGLCPWWRPRAVADEEQSRGDDTVADEGDERDDTTPPE